MATEIWEASRYATVPSTTAAHLGVHNHGVGSITLKPLRILTSDGELVSHLLRFPVARHEGISREG